MYFRDRCPKTLVSGLLFYLSLTLAQDTATQTIYSLSIFSSQKPCAQSCFVYNDQSCSVDYVGSAIGCVANGDCFRPTMAPNNCYCRTDLQSVAESYLTSCVQNSCTVGDSSIDISSAGSIYGYYCSSQGFPINVPATTTHEGTQAATIIASSPTSTNPGSAGTPSDLSTQGGGGSSTNPPSSGSLLNSGAIVAIAVIAGLVLLSVISYTTRYSWRRHKRKEIQARNPGRPFNAPYVITNPPQSVFNWSSNVPRGPPAPPSEYPESQFDFGRSN